MQRIVRSMSVGVGGTVVGLVLLLSCVAPSVSAAALPSVTISDSSSDVKKGVPAWQDIRSATVAATSDGNLSFSIALGVSLPAAPPLPNGTVLEEWWFCLSLASTFSVGGWPSATGNGTGNQDPCQYFVALWWDGATFAAAVANRTPLLSGGSPALAVIPFSISGSTVAWSVAPSLLGSATTFGFLAGTEDRSAADVTLVSSTSIVIVHGDAAIHLVDLDGSSTGGFVAWP